jgi:acetolactate synthase-1/2/3 large subunit
LFCNFGTDHAPTIEAIAERQKRGEKVPNVMLCPHENTAAHMAMGYAAVTGRGQAVLVHVDVGTANTANGMHNMFRSRLPVLLMAGKAPYTASNEPPCSSRPSTTAPARKQFGVSSARRSSGSSPPSPALIM